MRGDIGLPGELLIECMEVLECLLLTRCAFDLLYIYIFIPTL